MSAGRKIGGIIALILGFLMILLPIAYIILYRDAPGFNIIQVILNFVLGFVTLFGAIMALGNKKGGGAIVLLMGVVTIILTLVATMSPLTLGILMPYSVLSVFFTYSIPYITLESIVLIFAGVIILVSPE